MVDDDGSDPVEGPAGLSPGMSRNDSGTWPEFMTAGEVAWVVGLADFRTVYKMIHRGDLAAAKLGNQYRVSKAAVLGLFGNHS